MLPGLLSYQPEAQEGLEGGILFMAYTLLAYGLFAVLVGGCWGF